MNRRQYLASVGVATLGATAGCLSSGPAYTTTYEGGDIIKDIEVDSQPMFWPYNDHVDSITVHVDGAVEVVQLGHGEKTWVQHTEMEDTVKFEIGVFHRKHIRLPAQDLGVAAWDDYDGIVAVAGFDIVPTEGSA